MSESRKKSWKPLSEVYFQTPVALPGGPKNMLQRGPAFGWLKGLDRESTDRVVRVKVSLNGTSKTVTVPFENVVSMVNAPLLAGE